MAVVQVHKTIVSLFFSPFLFYCTLVFFLLLLMRLQSETKKYLHVTRYREVFT